MKILRFPLIITALALTTFSANAQISFGIKGGLNLSHAKTGVSSEYIKQELNVGFNAGLFAEGMFAEFVGVQSGLYFSTAGYKYTASEKGKEFVTDGTASLNLNTLQLPIHLAFKLPVGTNTKIVLHGGPYAAYLISGNETGRIGLGKAEFSIKHKLFGENSGNLYKRFDAGLGVGLGIDFGNFLFDTGYDWGLINLRKETKNNNYSTKTRNLYVSIGYKF